MAYRRQRTAILLVALALAGCSWVPDSVNPIAWYRDLTGASKNDALDKNAQNQKNLEAGGKEPYPNLASVPPEPGNATSQIDRDALQKSLVADRTNAVYSDELLRAGLPAPIAAPRPPAPGPAATVGQPGAGAAQQVASATPPRESSLQSPAIPSVPQGESPAPPPPRPDMGASPPAASPSTPVKTAALPPVGQRREVAQSQPLGSIAWNDGASLSDEALKKLSAIAEMQHAKGGALRIVGHAAEAGDDSQQKIQSFTVALTRAKAVAQALGSDGVPPQKLAVEAVPSAAGDAAAGTTEIFIEQ